MAIEDIGEVRSIALRMEVTDTDATWHLDKIRLKSTKACGGSGLDRTFFLQKWVKPSTQALLFPKAAGAADFEVVVYTADMRGAGTDGLVDIMVGADSASCLTLNKYPFPSSSPPSLLVRALPKIL